MKPALNPCEFELLCHVLAEIEALADFDRRLLMSNHRFARAMREVGVPFRPTHWKNGEITPARKMAYSRAIRRLEQAKFVTRVTESNRDRTTHVKPTRSAIAVLIDQLGEQVNRNDLLVSLSLTDWGQSLAKSLSR